MNLLEQIKVQSQKILSKTEIKSPDLISLLNSIEITSADLKEYHQPDPHNPYGRRVLLNDPRLEIMLATWTKGHPCAPHDHADSDSAIRILQGRARHHFYEIREEKLIKIFSEKKCKGEVLLCAPKQIHAMGDDGLELPLMTLHVYSASIPNMLVYDRNRTLLVKGEYGAWVPKDKRYILKSKEGHLYREELESVQMQSQF